MAIYQPGLQLSDTELRAIRLLDALLIKTSRAEGNSNSGQDLIEISIAEAQFLARFMEELRNSRKFIEAAHFTEAIASGRGITDDRAKEIYLSWRTRLGRTRVASTFVWNEFVLRSGFGFSGNARIYNRPYRSPVMPMPMDHFLAMEVKLAGAYKLSPEATQIIRGYYAQRLRVIEGVRKGERSVPSGTVAQSAVEFGDAFDAVAKCSPKKSLSKTRLAACTGLIMDVGTMFITRDWTATGVMSAIGATFPDVVGVE